YPLGDDSRRARSVLERDRGLVFALGGLSKLAALPQLKLAWTAIHGSPALVDEACRRLELVADTFLSPSAPIQVALESLLESSQDPTAALRARIARNLAELDRKLVGAPATRLHLEGGWYALVRLPDFVDETAFVLALLGEDGVLAQPGFFYDFER